MKDHPICLFENVKALKDPNMDEIISKWEKELNGEYFPQFLVISHPAAKKEFIRTLRNNIGPVQGNLDNLEKVEGDFTVHFQYGEDPEFVDEDETKIISIPWEMLKKAEIFWICSSSLENISKRILVNSDEILWLTNASMAMPQREREWLSETVTSMFHNEPITISLYNQETLNTREDVEALNLRLTKFALQLGKNKLYLANRSEALHRMFEEMDIPAFLDRREKRIQLACKEDLENYMKKQLELAEIDVEKLEASIQKVEAERKNIEFSSKFILNSTISNMYDEMRNKILDAADRYSQDACENVRVGLESSKDLEKDIHNIQPYLKAAWEHFEKEISKYMVSRQEEIAKVLERQISSDCQKIVGLLEGGSLGKEIDVLTAGMFGNTFEEKEPQTTKNKRISKGMLLTSIALAFVNPLWGLAGIVGTGVFNLSNAKNTKEAKEKVLLALPGECNRLKNDIERQLELTIENAKKESCDNVWKVYSEVLDKLMAEITDYMEQSRQAKERAVVLQKLLESEMK